MKYLFLAKSEDDPATRYRLAPVAERLRARGDKVDCFYEPGTVRQLQLLSSASSYDLVFVQRKLFNAAFASWLRRRARHLVFDFDDAVFLKSSGEPSATRQSRFAVVTEGADLVLGGNSYLCEAAGRYAEFVELVPTCVDVEKYSVSEHKPDTVTLVWIGSRSTSRYLEAHRGMLEKLGESVENIQLKVIGDFEFNLEHLPVTNVTWAAATEAGELGKSHIGIAPMVEDNWTRGKCALKVIQYMAAGLPVVSSDVGANRDVVREGGSGYLVSGDSAWIEAISSLAASPDLRARMGTEGRSLAEEKYSLQKTAERVVHLLDHTVA